MATLTFVTEGQQEAFELSGELTVGREAGNDVVLPEGGLSRKHCRFYEEGGEVFVEDFGSSNGTFVDGQRIEAPTSISEGQEILLANIAVQFSGGAARAGTPKRQATSARRARASSAQTGTLPAAGGRKVASTGAMVPRKGATPSGGRNVPARRGSSSPASADAAGQELAPVVRATLKGMTGPWAGKRYALANLVSTIGRVEGNDVVADDDSVSRRHAEIRKSGRGYVVRDLNSANGTYVNGERITEAPLRPGDVIKFGVVEFSYSGPSAGKMVGGGGPSDAERKKKLILFGGGGAVGLILLIAIVHAALSPPPQPVVGQAKNDPGQQAAPDVQALMGMCRSFSDTDGNTLDWQRAVKACDAVLKSDPINVDARKLKRLSAKELAQKAIYDHAHELFGLGQEEAAMLQFDKLDGESFYFAQARSDYRKAAESAKKRDGDACLSSERAGQHEKAWISCKQYEDIGCYQGVEDKYQRVFTALERRFKGKDTWTCPDKYKRWLGSLGGDSVDKRFENLKKKYPDLDLAKAINLFAKDPVQGRNALQKYRDRGRDAARAASLLQFEDLFYSKHQAAYEKMLRNDLKGAGNDITQEISADHQLMPESYEADVTMADRDYIANKYADQGKLYFTQQRYDKAFLQCNAGYQFTHANLNVSGCLADLEQYASGLDHESCDSLSLIMKITRTDTLQYKNAVAAKAKAGCR